MAFHAAERSLQSTYWKEHSVEPSVEAMMLDSQASKLDKEERPEVLAGHHHLSQTLAEASVFILNSDCVQSCG